MNKRWLRLFVGICVMLAAGLIYAWSALKAPLTAEFGWDGAQLQLCFTITLCCFCIGGTVSGLLGKKISVRVRMLAAAVMVLGGFALVSLAPGLATLYIGYGVLAGLGIGFVYNMVVSCTNTWFPDRSGLSSGCIMMAFGFSALLVGNVSNSLFAIEGFGWRKTYLLLGGVTAAIVAAAGFYIRAPKPEEVPAVQKKAGAVTQDYTTVQMLRRPSFWLLFVFFTLLAAVGSTAIGDAKKYLLSVGTDEALALSAAGLVSIFNGFGRLASGAAFDKLGLRRTQYLTSGVAIIAPLTALLGALVKLPALSIAGLFLCGFAYGFSPTVSAAFAGAFYGKKYYPLNFSVLNLVLIPASFTSTLGGALTASGTYATLYLLLTVFSVVGLGVNIAIRKA